MDIKKLVGGGSIYIDSEDKLVLNDYSGDYYAIPTVAAVEFAKLIVPELEKLGVRVNGIVAEPNKFNMNYFLRKRGLRL